MLNKVTHSMNQRDTLVSQEGFTLIELMVVIIIMGILAAVAVPNVFGLVERSKERIDLASLFYLRDSFDRAIVEMDAHGGDDMTSASTYGSGQYYGWKSGGWLKDQAGLCLFRIEVDGSKKVRFNTATLDKNALASGFWADALKDGGFGGVASGVGKSTDGGGWAYNITQFKSKTLTSQMPGQLQVCTRWKNGDEKSKSVEVYITKGRGTWNNALRGANGTCFSTIGESACK